MYSVFTVSRCMVCCVIPVKVLPKSEGLSLRDVTVRSPLCYCHDWTKTKVLGR